MVHTSSIWGKVPMDGGNIYRIKRERTCKAVCTIMTYHWEENLGKGENVIKL